MVAVPARGPGRVLPQARQQHERPADAAGRDQLDALVAAVGYDRVDTIHHLGDDWLNSDDLADLLDDQVDLLDRNLADPLANDQANRLDDAATRPTCPTFSTTPRAGTGSTTPRPTGSMPLTTWAMIGTTWMTPRPGTGSPRTLPTASPSTSTSATSSTSVPRPR